MIKNILSLLQQGESQTVEFFNPGKLYGGLSVEELLSGNYSSQTRNRAVARAFKEAGVIERYGSGIARIQNECKAHGKIKVKFEEFQHGFRITLSKIDNKSDEGIKSLYEFIAKDPKLRLSQISIKLNTPQKTLERWIKQLKDEEKLEYIGSKKTGGYVVKDEND